MAFKFNWINSFIFNVQRGVSAKYDIRNPEGVNESIGTTFETIWTPGDVYPWQSDAEEITVVSDDADDALGDTGAEKLELKMLDASGIEQTIVVDLNGLTPVAVPGTFSAVNSCRVIQAGSGEKNAGVITVTHDASDILAQIEDERGKALQAVYTIPSNKTGFGFGGYYSSAGMDNMTLELYTRSPGSAWTSSRPQRMNETNAQIVAPFNKFISGTQIEIRAKAQMAGAGDVTAGLSILLKNN